MRELLLILFLAVLSHCNGQIKCTAEREPKRDSTLSTTLRHPIETIDGIIYFSRDNGLTWENNSEGLPATAKLGLGAIAVSANSLGIATKDNGIYLFDFQKNSWVNIPTSQQILANNPGALIFYKNHIYVGTQFGGVFSSADQGKNWEAQNTGLGNLTIRKLVEIDQKLYAGTNAGFYSFDELRKQWELEYRNPTLQVNGITAFDGNFYIGTSQGVFTTSKGRKDWKQILAHCSLHNISSDDKTIYAMVYNELFSSVDRGKSWQSIQKGLPAQLYTFNVLKNGNSVFAGQWNGVYRKDNADESWKSYSKGLPEKFAVTNMMLYNGIIVVSGSERKLRTGITMDK